MNRMRTGVLALALAATAGCASGGAAAGGTSAGAAADSGAAAQPARTRRDLSVITVDEIQRSGAMNAYEAVERLRPLWLRSRRERTRGAPTSIVVYLNGSKLGSTDMLRRLEVIPVTSIRYLDAAAATSLPGLGSLRVEGAIMVYTAERGPEGRLDGCGGRDSGVPPAAPGSGCGSVADETTVCNGVEPRANCRRVSPLRAEIPHAGFALASAGAPTRRPESSPPSPVPGEGFPSGRGRCRCGRCDLRREVGGGCAGERHVRSQRDPADADGGPASSHPRSSLPRPTPNTGAGRSGP